MSVIEIESEDQFSSITNEPHQLVVIYFHTPWAAPCQQMAAVFATLAAAHAGAKFVLVNADEHAEISELFDVSAVPYFVLVRDAVILRELSGADPKELAAAVAEAAAPAAAPAPAATTPAALARGYHATIARSEASHPTSAWGAYGSHCIDRLLSSALAAVPRRCLAGRRLCPIMGFSARSRR